MKVQYEIVKAMRNLVDTNGPKWRTTCRTPIVLGVDLSIERSSQYYLIKHKGNFVAMHIADDAENIVYLRNNMCLTWNNNNVTYGDIKEENVQFFPKPLTRDDYFNLQLTVPNFDLTYEEFLDMISYNYEFLRIDVEEDN